MLCNSVRLPIDILIAPTTHCTSVGYRLGMSLRLVGYRLGMSLRLVGYGLGMSLRLVGYSLGMSLRLVGYGLGMSLRLVGYGLGMSLRLVGYGLGMSLRLVGYKGGGYPVPFLCMKPCILADQVSCRSQVSPMFFVSNAGSHNFPGCLLVGITTVKLHMELPCHSKSTLLESKANGMPKQY